MADDTSLTDEQQDAIDAVKWRVERATRQMVGNMLRVMRGAGRPWDLFEEVRSLAKAIESSTPDTLVRHITEAIEDALGDGLESSEDKDSDYDWAMGGLESGALRAVAARILQQPLQVHAGRNEMRDSFLQYERFRKQALEKAAAEVSLLSPINRKRIAEARRIAAAATYPPPKIEAAAKPKAKVSRPRAAPKPAAKRPAPEPMPEKPPEPYTTAEYMRWRAKQLKGQQNAEGQ